MSAMVTEQIYAQFREAGINPPTLLVPSRVIERFPVAPGDRDSGWYIGFENTTGRGDSFFVFKFGDNHRSDESFTAKTSGVQLDKHDKERIRATEAEASKIRERAKAELNRVAATKAKQRFEKASAEFAPNGYLVSKQLNDLFGARIDGEALLIPMRDVNGEIHNVEQIYKVFGEDKHRKHGLTGGARDGLFHTIGEMSDCVLLCEGYSTGVSLHLATGMCVIVAFNSGNLEKVATVLSRRYADLKIVVCADNDRLPNKKGHVDNVGAEKARAAASAVGGKFVIPEFPDEDEKSEDWDDMRRVHGLDAIQKQVMSVKPESENRVVTEESVIHATYPHEVPGTFKRKGTIENVERLCSLAKIKIRYNKVSKEVEIDIPGKNYSTDNKSNATYAELLSWCDKVGIATKNMPGIVTAISDKNSHNPVADWIESKPWDKVSRIQDLCDTVVARNEKTDLNTRFMKEKLMRAWMISAVAALYVPGGISAHGILIFQGEQNLGKTKWFTELVTRDVIECISEGTILNLGDKDSIVTTLNRWLVEFGEIDATLKGAKAGAFKAFVTRRMDPVRLPYAKGYSNFPRRSIFFGSVNPENFLVDPTGNRRFWTIECEEIKHGHNIDVQQLWAEIKELFDGGESWYLTPEEVAALNMHNERFEKVSPIHERIADHFRWDLDVRELEMTATQVCQEIGIRDPQDRDTQAAGTALKKLTGGSREKIKGGVYGYSLPPLRRPIS